MSQAVRAVRELFWVVDQAVARGQQTALWS
jgi:hypothetical protein